MKEKSQQKVKRDPKDRKESEGRDFSVGRPVPLAGCKRGRDAVSTLGGLYVTGWQPNRTSHHLSP
ncbi:MAG: hypothetical protein WBQ68_09325, partial [Terriglobales bacterium]